MDGKTADIKYQRENIRFLRRFLGLTQKDFIKTYLCDEDGKALMSVPTLSNLESKGGERLNEVVLSVSDQLGIDPTYFMIPPEQFVEKMDLLVPQDKQAMTRERSGMKKGSINQNLNRLTMYFAEQIFDKKLKKGDKIESDRELAAKLSLGRSAVREALKVLEVLGMIDIRPGQGMYISNNENNFFIIPLSWSMFLNGSQVDSIIEVRNVLEVKAAQLAAKQDDPDKLNRLHEISHRMHKAYIQEDYEEFLKGDLEFHGCIAECSGNPVIFSMLQTIRNLMKYVSGTGMVEESQLHDIYEEHQRVYGFIIAHDSDLAAKAMEEHMERSIMRYDIKE